MCIGQDPGVLPILVHGKEQHSYEGDMPPLYIIVLQMRAKMALIFELVVSAIDKDATPVNLG